MRSQHRPNDKEFHDNQLAGAHTRYYLPHRKRANAASFVTFRLAGTLPQSVLVRYREERHHIESKASAEGRPLNAIERHYLAEEFSRRIEEYLDAGHGSCWLSSEPIARLVSGALRHGVNERYDLYAWVVMPNHVHVVLRPMNDWTLSRIEHSWKSFTSHEALKMIPEVKAPFWQKECYDHLVRDFGELNRVIRYTEENPVKAKLVARAEDWIWSSAADRATEAGGYLAEPEWKP